mmetsp:Transcript_40217/g.107856  ORF Transcript_40217/g.107856 Transcript_40217/m.107856 type:complete len:123 (-) Transcript_40217:473-841(-)
MCEFRRACGTRAGNFLISWRKHCLPSQGLRGIASQASASIAGQSTPSSAHPLHHRACISSRISSCISAWLAGLRSAGLRSASSSASPLGLLLPHLRLVLHVFVHRFSTVQLRGFASSVSTTC